jgi:ubiquinone biosynthesis protein
MKNNRNENRRTIREVLTVLRKYNISANSDAHSIRLALEELGPTFVKLGQLITTQSDLFPLELVDELRGLRDEVAPMSAEEVDQVIFEAFGRNKESVFAYFDEEAHGSASISQVHHAVLKTGEDVAVKVQRIGVPESMDKDIAFLRRLVKRIPFLRKNPYIDLNEVINELQEITHRELDFTNEAKNLERFRELNEDVKYTTCPAVYPEYTKRTVMTMEYIKGIHPTDKEALIDAGYDLKEIARKYVYSFLKQVFVDGFFQADPHTGNIKISGGQIVWYDMGMMGEVSEHERISRIDTIESLISGDVAKCYDGLIKMCTFTRKYDKEELFKDVRDFTENIYYVGVENIDINLEVRKLMKLAKKHGARIDPSYTMMSRGMATVQGTITEICPELDFFSEIKQFAIDLRLSQYRKSKDKDIELLKKRLKLKKIKEIPENLADMVEAYSKGLVPIKIEMGIPEKTQPFIADIVKMIVDGIIIVALLVSSSIIILSGLKPLVFGIPALGFAGYVLAVLMILFNFAKRFIKVKD